MSITTEQIQGLTGKVYSNDSQKVGNIGQIYLDDTTGSPSWVTVKTGLFGASESFVPLDGGHIDGDDVYVNFSEDKIKDAPRIDADGSLSPSEEDDLYRYYGFGDAATNTETDLSTGTDTGLSTGTDTGLSTDTGVSTDTSTTSRGTGTATADHGDAREQVGHDTSGPTTDEAMTRSEERLDVGTATRESGKVRLRKHVVTENVTQTVPVSHEEVTLEREPISDENRDAAQSGPAISEEEHEVVLHEEVPVVEKDVVAVERVTLGKETVTEDATVSEDVRKEDVEIVDTDGDTHKH